MKQIISRRDFTKTVAVSVVATALPIALFAAIKKRHIKIGHTGITWSNKNIETAITDISGQGFWGFETFGEVFDAWESKPGGLGAVLQANNLPLISAYCGVNLTDPAQLKSQIDKTVRWTGIVKKYGGRFIVIGPNPVNRRTYDFAANKANIVNALNSICQAVSDAGLTAGLHQHTGMCVENHDETYAVMEAVNTKYVRFAPDIGQLQKGGSDALQVVKDFYPLIEHMHMKDWNGKDPHLAGYCPLGEGKVDVLGILDVISKKKNLKGMVMVELDYDQREDLVPLDLVKTSKAYLVKNGVVFRS